MVTLNPQIPAFKEFKALIMGLEPSPRDKPRLKRVKDDIEFPEFATKSIRDLCGGWYLTAAVLTIAAAGGTMKVDEVRRVLRFQRATSVNCSRVLGDLANRNILSLTPQQVTISSEFPAVRQLVSYARALMKYLPEYDLRDDAQEWRMPVVGTGPHGRIDWTRDSGLADRPLGVSPALDGTPLLFGTVSRFRALTTLAVNGPMRPADLVRATKMNQWTYQRLMDDGWLGKSDTIRGRTNRGTVDISSTLPARDEYFSLLKKLAERWPPKHVQHPGSDGDAKPRSKFKISKCFGSEPRTETLLTLAAIGTADVSTIQRGASSTDHGAIRRTILMLQHYGIVRYTEREGNSKIVELDPTWFAAAELRALLDALIPIDGRYAGRANSAVGQMSELRRKMGENARKKRVQVEIKRAPKLFVFCQKRSTTKYGPQTGTVEALGIAKTPVSRPRLHVPVADVVADIKAGEHEYVLVANGDPLNKKRWGALRIVGKPGRETLRTAHGSDPATLLSAKPKCCSLRPKCRHA
jgi:hypothetical protein